MDPHESVPVYLAPDAFKADLIKNMLEEEGIRAQIDSDIPTLEGFMVDVKVLVEASRAEEARKLIEEYEDKVIADSLAQMEKGDDESDSEPESENPAPAP
jgi:hypothetical protein